MTEPTYSPPPTTAACTIISPNYLPFARVLARSYRQQHPDQPFFVLIVADLTDPAPFAEEPFTAVLLPQLALPNLRALAMMYELLELNTNVKPTFMKYLLRAGGFERLVYLDPDIFCYAPLTPVFAALADHDAVLTPHLTTPVFDGRSPAEIDMLYNGTYNLGFFAVRASEQGLALLNWWERRCLDLGFSEGRTGLFVDQKWMNLAPGLFDHVSILRDPGTNMAYWNLNDRTLSLGADGRWIVNGHAPLCFFHFSGIEPDEPEVLSKHTDRFTLATRPDLAALFAAYKQAVQSERHGTAAALPYGFDRLSDGTSLNRLTRRLYAAHQAHFAGSDPFDTSGPFATYARRQGLLAGKAAPQKATWKQFSATDRRVAMVHRLLRLALKALGPNRYELLMRYLSYISVLRHQAVFLNDGLPRTEDPASNR